MISLIVGASAGLGRALSEQLAARGDDLFLISSDLKDLKPLASDLHLRYGVRVEILAWDLTKRQPESLKGAVHQHYPTIDNLFLIAGYTYPKDHGAIKADIAERILDINLNTPALLINSWLDDLKDNPKANIVGAGSVASGRGRRNNTIYGTAKRGLEFYFEALRHYLVNHACHLQFYRLGYLDTQMTFGQKLLFPVLSPEKAAQTIIKNLGQDKPPCYLPKWWWGIMTLIKLLPWPIFKKLDI
ncbi:SDR family NAD(P)-dependent oxidoreductase [Magnetococcales bacterium HHB-1]